MKNAIQKSGLTQEEIATNLNHFATQEQAEHLYASYLTSMARFHLFYVTNPNLPLINFIAKKKGAGNRVIQARTVAEAQNRIETDPSFNGWKLSLPKVASAK